MGGGFEQPQQAVPIPVSSGSVEIGDTYSATFRVIRETFPTLAAAGAIVMGPGIVIQLVVSIGLSLAMRQVMSDPTSVDPSLAIGGTVAYFLVLGISIVTYAIAQAMLMHTTVERLAGGTPTLGGAVKAAMSRLIPVVVVSFLCGLAVALGTFLCCAPGIFAWVVLILAVPACVVERAGIIDSLQRSISLTEGHRLPIFLVFLVAGAVYMVTAMCIVGPFQVIGATQVRPGEIPDPLSIIQLVQTFVTYLIASVFQIVIAVLTAVIYARLRGIKDNVDAQSLARVFA